MRRNAVRWHGRDWMVYLVLGDLAGGPRRGNGDGKTVLPISYPVKVRQRSHRAPGARSFARVGR